MQSIIGKFFFTPSIGSQSEQQSFMDLDDSKAEDGLRGHKTLSNNSLYPDCLCCVPLLPENALSRKPKMLLSLYRRLARFLA